MNRRELETIRKNNYSKLDRSYRNCLNHFEYDSGNSIEHEMAKFVCFVLLRNGVEARVLPKLAEDWDNWNKESYRGRIDVFGLLCDEIKKCQLKQYGQKFKEEWRRPMVITEARFKASYTPRKSKTF